MRNILLLYFRSEAMKFFTLKTEEKYFRFFGPNSFCHDYSIIHSEPKQPQQYVTIVAVFQ
jgi:hypothetical protein